MARTLTNTGLVLSACGLLVIHPRTLIAEADLPGLLPYLATMERAQRLHVASPHCSVVKDHDEGSDLFMIDACTCLSSGEDRGCQRRTAGIRSVISNRCASVAQRYLMALAYRGCVPMPHVSPNAQLWLRPLAHAR